MGYQAVTAKIIKPFIPRHFTPAAVPGAGTLPVPICAYREREPPSSAFHTTTPSSAASALVS